MARSVGLDRTRVVAAAAELADASGLEQLTLAQVAENLGVRLPSLYNHVAGLPGLRRELLLLGLRQLYERLSRAAIGKAGDEAVRALAHAYRAFVLEHPGLYAGTVRAPDGDDPEVQAAAAAVVEVVVVVLEPYRLGPDGAIHAVRGLRSICHGFATIEQAGGFGLALNRDESFDLLVSLFVAGLRAGAPR